MRKLIYILLACATSAQADITSYAALAEIDSALSEVYQDLDADWENSFGKEYLDILSDETYLAESASDTEAAIANAVAFINWDLFGLNESYDQPIELNNWNSEEAPAYALLQKPWNTDQTAPGHAIDKVNEILVDVYKVNVAGTLTPTEFYSKFNSDTGATAFNNAIDALKDINTHISSIVANEVAVNRPAEEQLDDIFDDDWMSTVEGEFADGSTYYQIALETGWEITFLYIASLNIYQYSAFNSETGEESNTQDNGQFTSITAAINHYQDNN